MAGPRAETEDLAAYVARRGDWLAACAYLLTKDHDAALDLTQDTLLQAWRAWDQVAAADSSEKYILRIMLNQFRSRRRRPTLQLVSLESEVATVGPDVAVAVDESNTVAQALSRLTQRQRAVVVLRYWADYDDEEIASILGCRRSTVRSLAARAVRQLKGYMQS